MKKKSVVVSNGVLKRNPELKEIIWKVYGTEVVFYQGESILKTIDKMVIDSENTNIIVCNGKFFDVINFIEHFGKNSSSLVLLILETDDEIGFHPEILSLKEVSFEEIQEENEITRIILVIKKIPLKRSDFYRGRRHSVK